MKNSGTEPKSDHRKSARGLSALLHKGSLVTSCLVVGAVTVGALLYVQAELLMYPPPQETGMTQSATHQAAVQNDSSEPMKKQTLETEELAVPPQAPQREVEQNTTDNTTDCDQKASIAAEQKYKESLKLENEFHQVSLRKISRLSKLLNTVSFGNLSNHTENENARHEQAVEKIESAYKQALAKANC